MGPFRDLDPLDRSILPLAPCLRQRFRGRAEDRMRLQGNSAILGLDNGLVGSSVISPVSCYADSLFYVIDASPNFPNSTMFSDSKTSGFGGWGNPADGYQITTGAFAEDFEVVYPVPHRIIRNYTETYDATPLTPTILWERFTPAAREAAVQGYVGDFAGIQAQIQGPTVSCSFTDHQWLRPMRRDRSNNGKPC